MKNITKVPCPICRAEIGHGCVAIGTKLRIKGWHEERLHDYEDFKAKQRNGKNISWNFGGMLTIKTKPISEGQATVLHCYVKSLINKMISEIKHYQGHSVEKINMNLIDPDT